MSKIKFKKNDEVIVISGKEKGKIGTIEKVLHDKQRVVIKDVNIVKKHNKPTQQNQDGSITEFAAPIHVSNVAYLVKKASKSQGNQFSKLGYKVNKDGKKVRVVRKTQKEI
ncbi:50S ribosomal protein L24 [Mycoplasmopsis canis UFG4]|uniref:Large ribosomal subunit protein uL24 n=2 Tax=Mycoplasmopsis canis TaxID=29555 RepID=I1A4P7_9BACT|nr:50S ribosomal protein L24 [Mycoplasmopsis canis]AMD81451.1 50S ribosomal protein L24 [Mycoplasmopsis canis PG 14]EIE39377.1 50S ribosomal protein L24 [Mycoplasmopsis canis UF33]EIE39682.1 50S ribosomal protein L24 [Mycoplasmopsis canis UF31]EIE41468.1 50S ribosomal protein L24 [Mycoplasmopsis canis UFG4]AKF41335.1 50S ribosomal protein L24 [Mycoplasmopsis canis]